MLCWSQKVKQTMNSSTTTLIVTVANGIVNEAAWEEKKSEQRFFSAC